MQGRCVLDVQGPAHPGQLGPHPGTEDGKGEQPSTARRFLSGAKVPGCNNQVKNIFLE